MKTLDELEGMTLWDIATNEGALTQLVLCTDLIIIGIAYLLMSIYCNIKNNLTRRAKIG